MASEPVPTYSLDQLARSKENLVTTPQDLLPLLEYVDTIPIEDLRAQFVDWIRECISCSLEDDGDPLDENNYLFEGLLCLGVQEEELTLGESGEEFCRVPDLSGYSPENPVPLFQWYYHDRLTNIRMLMGEITGEINFGEIAPQNYCTYDLFYRLVGLIYCSRVSQFGNPNGTSPPGITNDPDVYADLVELYALTRAVSGERDIPKNREI